MSQKYFANLNSQCQQASAGSWVIPKISSFLKHDWQSIQINTTSEDLRKQLKKLIKIYIKTNEMFCRPFAISYGYLHSLSMAIKCQQKIHEHWVFNSGDCSHIAIAIVFAVVIK